MNIVIYLKLLLLLVLAWVLALFPLHTAAAQDVAQENMVRLKIIKRIDGQLQMLDTLISEQEHAKLLGNMKDFKVDTAALRRLSSTALFRDMKADSAFSIRERKGMIYSTDEALKLRAEAIKGVHVERLKSYRLDTVETLNGKRFPIYKLDSTTTIFGRGPHADRLKFGKVITDGKTFGIKRSENGQIDTIKAITFHRLAEGEAGKTFRIHTGNPEIFLHAMRDSLGVFRQKGVRLYIDSLRAGNVEHIMIRRNKLGIQVDSLLKLHGKTSFRVETDEKTGQRRVFRMDADGVEHEVKGHYLDLGAAKDATIIILRTDVQQLNAGDRKALQNLGKPVETGLSNELKVDDISFYPNPNTGRFNLSFTLAQKGSATVRILDSTGKEIFQDQVQEGAEQYTQEIDISSHGRGLYFLQVAQGNRYHTKKILVK